MWIKDEISDAVKARRIAATELSPKDASSMLDELAKRYAVEGSAPLWERFQSASSVHDPEAWRKIGNLTEGEILLLVEDSQGQCGFLLENAGDLEPILSDCSGFEFYVTDLTASFALAFNHHDMLISVGSPRRKGATFP